MTVAVPEAEHSNKAIEWFEEETRTRLFQVPAGLVSSQGVSQEAGQGGRGSCGDTAIGPGGILLQVA